MAKKKTGQSGFKVTFAASPAGRRSANQTGLGFYSAAASIPSAHQALRIITENLLKAFEGPEGMQKRLQPAIEKFMQMFNERVPLAVKATTHTRSGTLAEGTKLYIGTSTKDGWVLKLQSPASRYARVQEKGRRGYTRTPTIEEHGTNPRGIGGFSIGGGKPYWVPLKSAVGYKPAVVRDMISSVTKLRILPKVFKGKYLIAGTDKAYAVATANRLRKQARKTGDWSQYTKATFKPMFAIYVGKTGVPGFSASRFAKDGRSPGRWLSRALEMTVPDFLAEFKGNKSTYLRPLLKDLGSL